MAIAAWQNASSITSWPATAIISALKEVPVKQEVAMTGSLSVRGEVLPIGGVSAKVEAAIATGIKIIIVPKSNLQDIVVDKGLLDKVKIIPVTHIEEVLEYASFCCSSSSAFFCFSANSAMRATCCAFLKEKRRLRRKL